MLLLIALILLVVVFLMKGCFPFASLKCSNPEGYDDDTTYKTVGGQEVRDEVYTDEMRARGLPVWHDTPYEYDHAGYDLDPEWYYSNF